MDKNVTPPKNSHPNSIFNTSLDSTNMIVDTENNQKKRPIDDVAPDDPSPIKLFPDVDPSILTDTTSVFNIPSSSGDSYDRPQKRERDFAYSLQNMQTVQDMVNIVKKKFYEGYHPLIVKKKFDDLKNYVTDYFKSDKEFLTALKDFDYMKLIFPLRINSHFHIRAFTNYIETTFKIRLNPFGPPINACCYIEICSHGGMVIQDDHSESLIADDYFSPFPVASATNTSASQIPNLVSIDIPSNLEVWMTRTSQITNYSYGGNFFPQDIRTHCPLKTKAEFEKCFYRKAEDFQKFSLKEITNPRQEKPNNFDIRVSERTLPLGKRNPNIYDKNLYATRNPDEYDGADIMRGVFIHYNTCGFCPGMDLLKTTEFKLFMLSGCVTLNDFVKTYIPEIYQGNKPIFLYYYVNRLCSAYDNDLNDPNLRIFLNTIYDSTTINIILSASKFVVKQYKLSDVIKFFIKIKLDRLIILDKSCSCIQKPLDPRTLRRVRRGGMSKKQRSKTQKRKKNKTRRNKK